MAMATVMTAKTQLNASVAAEAGTARWAAALSEPSQGDSGRPSGIMSRASTSRPGAAASSISAAPNRARQASARAATGDRQVLLP